MNLVNDLSSNTYPGRGIVLGVTPDGKHGAIAYFIMGRSVNSRNRVFVTDGDGIRTQAFDPAQLKDPSLVIYAPVRKLGDTTIVTNGDQTDTIYDFLEIGSTFEAALSTRRFEPDPPNYTPRISGMMTVRCGKARYSMSILKSADGDPSSDERFYFNYENPLAGKGHFIHTYKCDGNPIPTFEGAPKTVEICGDLDEFTNSIWNALNEENKVSLFTRFIDLETGEFETRIINKNK